MANSASLVNSNMEKNVCPCCGRREGVLLVHEESSPSRETEQNADEISVKAQNRFSDRRFNGYHAFCNRQCLCCEFAWRIADHGGVNARTAAP